VEKDHKEDIGTMGKKDIKDGKEATPTLEQEADNKAKEKAE
jgi:hypothetical protein